MAFTLPPPKPSQAYVNASILEAGYLTAPEHVLIKGGLPTTKHRFPCLCFLLRHSQTDKKIIFDLGLRKDWEAYPPGIVDMVKNVFGGPIEIPSDAIDSLRAGGLEPKDIDTVVLSHVHFDHVGDPSLFPSSNFVVGAESKELLENGYTPGGTEASQDSHFSKDLLPDSRTAFLSYEDWEPIGPFPRAYDFYGDGSVYLIDAAGHLPGHVNALVRTSPDGGWLFLAGDSAHDARIISGEKEIGMYNSPLTGVLTCMHRDLEGAKKHIERIRQVKALGRVEVVLAHDVWWYEVNRGKGIHFPGKLRPL